VSEKKPREVVKELVLGAIQRRPKRITLSMKWGEKRNTIRFVNTDGLDETVECGDMSFTSFGYGVVDAFREAFGELTEIGVSFRETIYENEKVVLDLYPTGSAGIFDIYVSYK